MQYSQFNMNTATFKALGFGFSLVLFTTALGYMIYQSTEIAPSFKELKEANATVFILDTDIPKEVYWTGEQVVGKLYRLTEEDISIFVNGFEFKTDKEVKENMSLVNLNAYYKESVQIDSGIVVSIEFTEV